MTKRCTRCKTDKPAKDFGKRKDGKNGLMSQCRQCKAEIRFLNRDRINKCNEKWEAKNKESISLRHKVRYATETPERRMLREQRRKKRREKGLDKETSATYALLYHYQNYNISVEYTLRVKLRNRLTQCIKKNQKAGSAVRDLGCSTAELKRHIESQFTEGMTWENWGKDDKNWSIDHIMPLSRFNLENRQHFLLANHYLNLRPLWHIENIQKSANLPMEMINAAN